MSDTLRTRIAAVQAQHQPTIVSAHGLVECSCSPGWRLSTMTDHGLHVADAVIRELDDVLVDWGLWLAEEITGRTMTRLDMESCLTDWKANDE